jgi:hypothetical protein
MNWKTILAVWTILLSGTLYAKTPDGVTPADEAICDLESGAAYGLCNAYCEAMDCDGDQTHASATACQRVQDRFTQKTGRDLPCLVPPAVCPCYTYDDVAYIAGTFPLPSAFSQFCHNGPSTGAVLFQSIEAAVGDPPPGSFDSRDSKAWESMDTIWDDAMVGCEYQRYVWNGESSEIEFLEWTVPPTAESRPVYLACKAIMDAVFEAYPLDCD